jgi:hypothetical protein
VWKELLERAVDEVAQRLARPRARGRRSDLEDTTHEVGRVCTPGASGTRVRTRAPVPLLGERYGMAFLGARR